MSVADRHERRVAAGRLRARAAELEAYAAARRREGDVYGPEGAEDAEAAAVECWVQADELDLGPALGKREETS